MKAPIITKEKFQVDVADEVMSFMLKVVAVLSAVIGIWAVICLTAGLISVGPLQMARGYISAITGF